jgi:hypothetical protein
VLLALVTNLALKLLNFRRRQTLPRGTESSPYLGEGVGGVSPALILTIISGNRLGGWYRVQNFAEDRPRNLTVNLEKKKTRE